MKETETYTKVHDFLYEDLHLPEVPMRVFAFIFSITSSGGSENIWGIPFIAAKTHLSTRSVKQAIKCLTGIGILRKDGVAAGGAFRYIPAVGNAQTTSQAKDLLVHAVRRCISFTGEPNSPKRCTACTYGGAYRAPQIKHRNINNNIPMKEKNSQHYGKDRHDRCEPPKDFRGSDTL